MRLRLMFSRNGAKPELNADGNDTTLVRSLSMNAFDILVYVATKADGYTVTSVVLSISNNYEVVARFLGI